MISKGWPIVAAGSLDALAFELLHATLHDEPAVTWDGHTSDYTHATERTHATKRRCQQANSGIFKNCYMCY